MHKHTQILTERNKDRECMLRMKWDYMNNTHIIIDRLIWSFECGVWHLWMLLASSINDRLHLGTSWLSKMWIQLHPSDTIKLHYFDFRAIYYLNQLDVIQWICCWCWPVCRFLGIYLIFFIVFFFRVSLTLSSRKEFMSALAFCNSGRFTLFHLPYCAMASNVQICVCFDKYNKYARIMN